MNCFSNLYIGCAGWSLPKEEMASFPATGSHLERYAQRFRCVEINSSFYRPHQAKTYARWAASVPKDFRFAVKVPRAITHDSGLVATDPLLAPFLSEVSALGDRLGPLLVQLPPRFVFRAGVVRQFFTALRRRFAGDVVCEPRHTSWFTTTVTNLLTDLRIARVAADPAVVPEASEPAGWEDLIYYRLHGSPQMYYSSYSREDLGGLKQKLLSAGGRVRSWCIFDNTALGAATKNGLELMECRQNQRHETA